MMIFMFSVFSNPIVVIPQPLISTIKIDLIIFSLLKDKNSSTMLPDIIWINKRTVSVISRDPPCKDVRFTTIPCKPLSDQ